MIEKLLHSTIGRFVNNVWISLSVRGCWSSTKGVCLSLLSSVYSCALLRDILLQGRLYISRHWLCFYANLFGKDIKVEQTDNKAKTTDRLLNSLTLFDMLIDTTWQAIWLKVSQALGQTFSAKSLNASSRNDSRFTVESYTKNRYTACLCHFFFLWCCVSLHSLLLLKPKLSWLPSDNKLLIQAAFLTFWLKRDAFLC